MMETQLRLECIKTAFNAVPTEAAVAGRPPYRAAPQGACCYAISSGFSIKSIRLM